MAPPNSLLGQLMNPAAVQSARLNSLMPRRLADYRPDSGYRLPAPVRRRPQGEIRAYRPTPSQRLGDIIQSAVRGIGFSPETAHRARREAGNIPVLGDILTGLAGVTDLQRGDYLSGAGQLGMAALGAVPGVGDAAAAGARRLVGRGPIRAYHGSPYDFDRFEYNRDRMMTGEGTAAYGEGLYLAENPEVAGTYAVPRVGSWGEVNDVPPEVLDNLRGVLRENDYLGFDTWGEAVGAIRGAPTNFENIWELNSPADADRVRTALQAYDEARWRPGFRPRLYEVDINAAPEDFIDYDLLGPRDALRALNEGAAPGLRFLDRGSRQAGTGTYNYVVRDPSLIDIVNKY